MFIFPFSYVFRACIIFELIQYSLQYLCQMCLSGLCFSIDGCFNRVHFHAKRFMLIIVSTVIFAVPPLHILSLDFRCASPWPAGLVQRC